jgi:hypothetical protein
LAASSGSGERMSTFFFAMWSSLWLEWSLGDGFYRMAVV